jgi:hypothetical protein
MSHYDFDDELTEREEALFAALPRLAREDRLAEERTVSVLRRMGLLGRRGALNVPLKATAAIAAALVLFFSGVAYGKRDARPAEPALSPVAELQRAGSAYVAALVRLSDSTADDADALAAGLEVGTSTLRAVAFNASSRLPADSTLVRIHDGLEMAAAFTAGAAASERALIWY